MPFMGRWEMGPGALGWVSEGFERDFAVDAYLLALRKPWVDASDCLVCVHLYEEK